MRILYFGDVFGKPGREALKAAVSQLTAQQEIDFVIANGENASHGNGILPEMAQSFIDFGVDVITLGNHAWDQRQIIPYMSMSTRVIRPANYPEHPLYKVPGRGSTVVESRRGPGLQLGVIQVMGRVFMDALECPFRTAEKEAEKFDDLGIRCLLVDFHAEATSEKQALGYYLDGKVSAVVGSHSHVQTSDERVLPGGTAVITDVGMTGCFDSVIGVKKEISIQKFPAQTSRGRETIMLQFYGPHNHGAQQTQNETGTPPFISIVVMARPGSSPKGGLTGNEAQSGE